MKKSCLRFIALFLSATYLTVWCGFAGASQGTSKSFDLPFDALAKKRSRGSGRGGSDPVLYPPEEESTANSAQQEFWLEQSSQLFHRLQLLEEEIARLSSVVEERAAELQRLKEEQQKRYLDLDQRIKDIGSAPAAGATGSSGGNYASGEAEAQATYKEGIELAKVRSFDRAIVTLQGLLKSHPRSQFVPGTLSLLGDIYGLLPKPDLEKSRKAFLELSDRFPDHKKTPEALYKVGGIYDQLGDKEKSKHYMKLVVKDYPNSTAARLAANYRDGSSADK